MVFSGFVGSNLRVDKEFNSLHNWAASALSLFLVAVCDERGTRGGGDERGR